MDGAKGVFSVADLRNTDMVDQLNLLESSWQFLFLHFCFKIQKQYKSILKNLKIIKH